MFVQLEREARWYAGARDRCAILDEEFDAGPADFGERATDVPGKLLFAEPELAPGARAQVEFELGRPIAIEPQMRFAMREGGRSVGAGLVTSTT